MQSNIAQLSNEAHKNVKLVVNKNFEHVTGHHMTPVIMQEIPRVASELPVAFVKNSQTDDYMCVGILGLKEGENLMVKDGAWQGSFIPAGYTHFPLSLVPYPEDDSKYAITIDTDSNAINDEGDALFNEDGSETEYLQTRRKSLETYYKCAIATREFTKTLLDMELLTEQGFSFEMGDDKRNVTGLHIVDEEKFNALSDEQIIDLRKKGYLAPIYAHLMSLAQMNQLVKRIPAA